MRLALPLAVLCGVVVAVGVHALLPDWPVAAGTGAVYAGVAYFALAFDVSLRDRTPEFEDRRHRVGYALGVFGVSVTPLVLAAHYASVGSASAALLVAVLGIVAFLELSAAAAA